MIRTASTQTAGFAAAISGATPPAATILTVRMVMADTAEETGSVMGFAKVIPIATEMVGTTVAMTGAVAATVRATAIVRAIPIATAMVGMTAAVAPTARAMAIVKAILTATAMAVTTVATVAATESVVLHAAKIQTATAMAVTAVPTGSAIARVGTTLTAMTIEEGSTEIGVLALAGRHQSMMMPDSMTRPSRTKQNHQPDGRCSSEQIPTAGVPSRAWMCGALLRGSGPLSSPVQ